MTKNDTPMSDEQDDLALELRDNRQAVVSDPLNPDYHYNLGLSLLKTGSIEAALKEFKIATQLKPSDSQTLYNLAYCYQLLGYSDSAIARYEKALALNQTDDQAWHNLASIHFENKDFPRAAYCVTKATELCPERMESWSLRSLAEYGCQNYTKAEESARSGLNIKNDDSFLWGQLGVILNATGDWASARDASRRSLELDNGVAEVWNNLGISYFSLANYGDSISAYQKAIELDPNNSDYLFNLGEAYHRSGNQIKAEDLFLAVVSINKTDLNAWKYLGAYAEKDRPDEAIIRFQTILDLTGDKIEPLSRLAELYGKTGDHWNELKIRLRLLKVDAHIRQNNQRIAEIYIQTGSPEIAYRHIQQCDETITLDPGIWERLAQYYQSVEKTDEELDCLSHLIRGLPEHSPAWIRLGEFAIENNMSDEAYLYLKKGGASRLNDLVFWTPVIAYFVGVNEIGKALDCCQYILPLLALTPDSARHVFGLVLTPHTIHQVVKWVTDRVKAQLIETPMIIGLVKILRDAGYFAAAEETLRVTFSERSNDVAAGVALGKFLLENGKREECHELAISLESKFPSPIEITRLIAYSNFYLDNLSEAESALRSIVARRSDEYAAQLDLARISYLQNNANTALASLEEAMALNDRDGDAWRLKGKIREQMNRSDEARQAYSEALMLNPRDFISLDRMGAMALDEGQHTKAKHYLLKSVSIHPLYAFSWEKLVDVFERSGETRKSQRCRQLADTSKKVVSPLRLALI